MSTIQTLGRSLHRNFGYRLIVVGRSKEDLMFGLVGGVINAVSFLGLWGAVSDAAEGTVEAGSSVKKWFDEQETERLSALYSEFVKNRDLPDLSLSHIQAVRITTPGVCNISWTEISTKLGVEPDDPTFDWHDRTSSDGGRGWIGFMQQQNVFGLYEQYRDLNKAVITFAQLVDDYWLVFQSIAERNNNDSSPCMLTYTSEIWKPDGIGEIFFGASQSKLEPLAEQFLNEMVAAVRSEYEIIATSTSVVSDLESLVSLREAGQLSDDEFLAAKKKIIGS
jgi:hypothetical protein